MTSIDPSGVYDDGQLVLMLGVTHEALAKARRGGELPYRRVGRRFLYVGQALIQWLSTTSAPDAERPEAQS
jgi:hypothetical protein